MPRIFAAFAAALAAAGCSLNVNPADFLPAAPDFKPIASPGEFLDAVAGSPITFENGAEFTNNPDGTITGEANGQPVTGSWTFQNGQLCRSLTVGGSALPEVCNIVEIAGDDLRFLNPDGTLSSEASLGEA